MQSVDKTEIKEMQKNNLMLATLLLFSAKQAALSVFVYLLEIQNVAHDACCEVEWIGVNILL